MTIDDSRESSWPDRILSVLRVVSGFLFMVHGTQKIFHWPESEKGYPPAGSLGFIGGYFEIVLGALLIVGLFTRLAAFLASGEMAVAYFQAHAPKGFLPIENGGELATLYCFLFFYLAFAGGGAWSLDALFFRRRR
jgi:putative oxidoreductase